MFNSRGDGYVISALILILIVFGAAGVFYYWHATLQLSQQGAVEQSQERFANVLGACISVTSMDYDTFTNQSNVVINNCGNSKVEIGDTKIKDIGVLQGPSIDPCSFSLNETTCVGCPFVLEPKSSKLITINWTAQPACANRIAKGIKHQVVFYIDRVSTAPSSFVPLDFVADFARSGGTSAACGVIMANQSPLLATATQNLKLHSNCFNITLTNTGTIDDSFAIALASLSSGWAYAGCYSASIRSGQGCLSADVINPATIGVALSSGKATQIYVNVSAGIAVGDCLRTLGAASQSCATSTVSMDMNFSLR